MYKTRKATKVEENKMRESIPSPLGHTVTGYTSEFSPIIETCSEETARGITIVEYIRRKQPNGKYLYRTIVER